MCCESWPEKDSRSPRLPLVIQMSLSEKRTSKVEVWPGAIGAEGLGPDEDSELAAAAPGDPHIIVQVEHIKS